MLDHEVIEGHTSIGNMQGFACGGIELPTVPGTDKFAVVDHASAERTSAVRTNVVHGGELSIYPGHADLSTAAIEFLGLTFRGKI